MYLIYNVPYYLGHPYSVWGSTYNSGGAGYVLSRAAVRKVLSMMSKGHCEMSYTAEDNQSWKVCETIITKKTLFGTKRSMFGLVCT